MATLTLDETITRARELTQLADTRNVSLAHIELRNVYEWVVYVEDLLDVAAGAEVPNR